MADEEMHMNQPIKRSARKEVYGFVGWMASWVLLCMFWLLINFLSSH